MGRALTSAWNPGAVFLRLRAIPFDGPVTQSGYFLGGLVKRWRWLEERSFAVLVAFGQVLLWPAGGSFLEPAQA